MASSSSLRVRGSAARHVADGARSASLGSRLARLCSALLLRVRVWNVYEYVGDVLLLNTMRTRVQPSALFARSGSLLYGRAVRLPPVGEGGSVPSCWGGRPSFFSGERFRATRFASYLGATEDRRGCGGPDVARDWRGGGALALPS